MPSIFSPNFFSNFQLHFLTLPPLSTFPLTFTFISNSALTLLLLPLFLHHFLALLSFYTLTLVFSLCFLLYFPTSLCLSIFSFTYSVHFVTLFYLPIFSFHLFPSRYCYPTTLYFLSTFITPLSHSILSLLCHLTSIHFPCLVSF